MLSMPSILNRCRRVFLLLLFILCFAWIAGEAAQWLVRLRAQKLLADIDALQVNHSTFADAQQLAQKWSAASTAKPGCTSDDCTVQIALVQTLPPFLVGSTDPGAHNLIPRLVDHTGLRSVAARAGFTVEHNIVTSKWFGEQTTLPVRDLGASRGYVPYLSASSAETTHFREIVGDSKLANPNRMAQHLQGYLQITFSPDEDPSEQTALMDFSFSCLTQFHPCENEAEILPSGSRLLQDR